MNENERYYLFLGEKDPFGGAQAEKYLSLTLSQKRHKFGNPIKEKIKLIGFVEKTKMFESKK